MSQPRPANAANNAKTGESKLPSSPRSTTAQARSWRRSRLIGGVAIASAALLLAGCAAPPAQDSDGLQVDTSFLPCMVADTGGFNDRSFNQSAHEGIQEAAQELGLDLVAVESDAETDYDSNVSALVDRGCDLIITVGFLLADATVKAARVNPDVNFAIIDDRADVDGDGETDSPNIKPLLFDVAPAAFLAGYAAASHTKTGVVGTFAGMNIPPVTIFADGYAQGVDYYNEKNGTDVEVLGWDVERQDGLVIGSFVAGTPALTAVQGLLDQGADIVQTGGGTTFQSIIAAFRDVGKDPVVVGGDSDMYHADPENADVYLISVLKGTKVAVIDVIKETVASGFDNAPYIGTLANGGVGISPFHSFESLVDPGLAEELAEIEAHIIEGSITVSSPSSPN